MKLLLPLFLVFAFIAGCGSDRSGSSSSGSGGSGGSGGGTGTRVNFATLAGDYAGNASVRVSTLLASDTINSRVTATIDSRGRIEITFDDDAVATGQLARDGTFRISDTTPTPELTGARVLSPLPGASRDRRSAPRSPRRARVVRAFRRAPTEP
ncbi:MAG: hypothetical protein M5U09_26430 [Gammaproteobacteria bacterium]|nr:hypothetical protein [Gammaproteobacteria bacterium]